MARNYAINFSNLTCSKSTLISIGGVVEEDFSWFGLGGSSSRVCREDEVVKCQQLLQMGGDNTAMLPFLIHHFEELCWQAREENKGMIVVLVNSRQRGVAQRGAMLSEGYYTKWNVDTGRIGYFG